MKKILILIFVLSVTNIFAQQYTYIIKRAFPNLVFNRPTELIPSIDKSNRLFMLQQRGIIYVFKNDSLTNSRKIFINLPQVSQQGYEGGLQGMAFHPNYVTNRYFYVHYTFDSVGLFWSRISRITASATNPDTALNSTERILMTIAQPLPGHKGGKIQFGNDGYLYIALGDGGGTGDPYNNAQNKSSLLGKILRIDVNNVSPGKSYAIPPSNPFYGNSQGFKEEIFAYGLRNPWKFSVDYQTNRIWAGDVGQFEWEEVDIIESGKNYGWNKMEGFHCYGTCDTTGKGFTRPVWEFWREMEHAVIGGYVYRGMAMPSLYGKYLYGDLKGYVWAITYNGTAVTNNVLIHDYFGWAISTFGLTEDNEFYIVGYYDGYMYRLVNKTAINVKLKMAIEGFYETKELNMRDTVTVNLRNSTSPYALVNTAKTIIDSNNFTGGLFFENATSGNYYLQIKHRNSIETWSKVLNLSNTVVNNFDMTTSMTQAFGNNLVFKNGKYCIYSGDSNQDGVVDLNDLGAVANGAYNYTTGYSLTDLTGDKFADMSDLQIADNNSELFIAKIVP